MPKKDISGNIDIQHSYEGAATKPNTVAIPTQTIVGMFRYAFRVQGRT